QAALVELAHTELELRLDAGQPARVEDYLGRFPELAADPALAGELIVAEFALRRARGAELSHQEDLVRFPQHADALAGCLAQGQPGAAPTVAKTAVTAPAGGGGAWPVVPGYTLLAELGRGGMGVVYRARQAHLHREVALKVIRDSALTGAEGRLRFLAE